METGKYGGVTTDVSTLPVGTNFYVCNGAWDGVITMIDGVKHLTIKGGKSMPLTKENAKYELDIEIEGQDNQTI
ncbi:hypothetical protein [Bacillus sp. Marseille-P3800]|uniref:hypothetical protein n=1 Tax=Bacillus sp. Marseille-P3800 TaxID=2014782 RepID=UPI000C06E1BC|nr:hypothetical protein [Bacillus sp. Marseille-P3800]